MALEVNIVFIINATYVNNNTSAQLDGGNGGGGEL